MHYFFVQLHCESALSNLISSDKVQESDDPLKSFSEAITLTIALMYPINEHQIFLAGWNSLSERREIHLSVYRTWVPYGKFSVLS